MPSLVSVVILNFNTRNLLAQSLASIQRYAPQANVLVVDNASSDDSVTTVRRDFPDVHLIANSENRGFSYGMNQGIRATLTPYVLALNADTELLSTTLEPLLSAVALPQAGILAPVQFSSDHTPLASAFPDPTLRNEIFRLLFFSDAIASRLRQGPWRAIDGGMPFSVDWLIGAALFFRRECFDMVGGFDEGQFMYGEDWDICYRARQAGWRVYLVPESQIIHHENASAKNAFGNNRLARVLEGNLYFHERHFGKSSRRRLAMLHLIAASARMAVCLPGRITQHPSLAARWQAYRYQAQVALRAVR